MSKPNASTSIPTTTTTTTSTGQITPPLFSCPVITVSSSSSTSSKAKQCLALLAFNGKQKACLVALSSSHPSAASRTIAIAEVVKRQFSNRPKDEGDNNTKPSETLYQYTQLSSTLIDWPPPKSPKKKEQSTSTQSDKKRKSDDGVVAHDKEHGPGKRRKLNDAPSRADDNVQAEPIVPASPVGDRTFHEDDEGLNQDDSDDDPMAELSKPIDLNDLNSVDVEDDLDDEDEDPVGVDDDNDDNNDDNDNVRKDDDDDPMAGLSKPINLDDIQSSQEDEDDDGGREENDSEDDLTKPEHNFEDMSINPSTPPPPQSTSINITHTPLTTNIGDRKYKGIPPLQKIIIDNPRRRKREKRENVTIGQERQKVRALPVLTIYLSTMKHAKLASLYGEQTYASAVKSKRDYKTKEGKTPT